MNTQPTPRTDANVKRHNLCRLSGNDLVYADFARQLERERDELKRWTSVNGVIDLQRERDEARGKLAAVTEQRDGLAKALRLIADGTSCRECGGEDQALFARQAMQSMSCDALQSLTPNEL
jgi:hypothetical protein